MRFMRPVILLLFLLIFAWEPVLSAAAETPVSPLENEGEETVLITEATDETVEIRSFDADEMAEGYIRSRFPSRPVLRIARPSGAALTGPTRNLYLLLREQVAQVAGGSRESTEFVFSAADIYGQEKYFAEDLEGVETIKNEDGSNNEDALAAVRAIRAELNWKAAVECVFADSPYESYWRGSAYSGGLCTMYVGKIIEEESTGGTGGTGSGDAGDGESGDGGTGSGETGDEGTGDGETGSGEAGNEGAGSGASGNEEEGTETTGGQEKYYLKLGETTIRIKVSEDYQKDSEEYRMDTTYAESVGEAAENAAAILARYESLEDYERLKAYRDEICELTSYNNTAVQEYNSGARGYGDPWQLVWVFDGDPETKVVCEGYSKAFQYLNDLSAGAAQVISVRGYIYGDVPHMWNIVYLEGHQYLADLTNTDGGNRDILFLKGCAGGSVADGYDISYGSSRLHYIYSRDQLSQRTADELRIETYDYTVWREAVSSAPTVRLSSVKALPGYAIAVKAETALPAEKLLMNGVEMALTDGVGMILPSGDEEIRFSAVITGVTTPETEPFSISLEEEPAERFRLPAGAAVEEEAFAGIGAKVIEVSDNEIAPDAFDGDAILKVDETGSWFDSGCSFVVRVPAEE